MYFNSRSNSNISLRKKQLLILYIVKAHIFINYRQVFHLRKEHIKGSVHEKLEFLLNHNSSRIKKLSANIQNYYVSTL